MEGAALALVFTALYCVLAQQQVYGEDAYYLISYSSLGIEHAYHLLYLRLVTPFAALLRWFDIGLFEAMRAASAVGTGCGVYLFWLAARLLRLERLPALLVGTLCATAPAVVFYATVVEIHGVFTAFAGLSAVAWARASRRVGACSGALLGCTTALASLVHASGHLLVGLWLLLLLGERRVRHFGADLLRSIGACAGVHAALAVAGTALLQPARLDVPGQGIVEFLRSWLAAGNSMAYVGSTLVFEWILPFFPLSVLVLVGRRCRRDRLRWLCFAAGLATYVCLACVVLQGTVERGAYLIPLVFPAAVLLARTLPVRAIVVGCALAAAVSIHEVRAHDRPNGEASFAAGVVELSREQPVFVICRAYEETHALMRGAADVPFVSLVTLLQDAKRRNLSFAQWCAAFDFQVRNQAKLGRQVLFSRRAWVMLEQTDDALGRGFLREHLARQYRASEVQRLGFTGYRLAPW